MTTPVLLQKDLVELYRITQRVLALHNKLKAEVDGQLVEYLKTKYPEIIKILMGGVIEKEVGYYDYTKKSIAKFCNQILGIEVKIADLGERLKIGAPLDVEVNIEDTSFIKFVNEIKTKIEDILYLYDKNLIENNKSGEINLEEFFKNPQLFVEIIKDFIQNMLNILPNYNEESFKIWSLEMLTYKYIIANYPEFKDDQKFEEFCRIFGYIPYFVPDFPDEQTKKEYTIYKFGENSIGKKLRELFMYIWDKYSSDVRSGLEEYIIPLPKNPKEEFLKNAVSKLNEVGIKIDGTYYDSIIHPLNIRINVENYYSYGSYRGGYEIAKYFIKGSSIVKVEEVYYTTGGNVQFSDKKDLNISIFSLLDEIMPFVFFFQDLIIKLILEEEGEYWILRVRYSVQ